MTIVKNAKDEIISFKVEVYAGYALSDCDIVCADVSSLVIGTVNGFRELTDAEFDAEVDEGVAEVIIRKTTAYSNILLRPILVS